MNQLRGTASSFLAVGLLLVGAAGLVACADRERPLQPSVCLPDGGGEGEGEEAVDLGPADLGDVPGEPDAAALAGYREACEQNADCESGWCVPFAGGFVCTRPCTDDCEDGWFCRGVTNTGSDISFICLPPDDKLCAPCVSDDDCSGGHCVVIDVRESRKYCTQACLDGTCREGFACSSLTLADSSVAEVCLPSTGTCSCIAENEGLDRLCRVTNEDGQCLGRETCIVEQGWVGCDAATPVPEVCNQVDDDCNGFADDVPGLGTACTREATLGEEQHSCAGVLTCSAGSLQPVCTAAVPVAEVCNLKDDDCDGEIDEDYPQLGAACGSGTGACMRSGAWVCDEQTGGIRCSATEDVGSPEQCNALDDDCDGQTDEDFREERDGVLGRYVALEHCGICGHSCQGLIPYATARCETAGPDPTCVVEACDPSYYQAGPALCLPFDDPSCRPCADDVNCGMPGNRCLTVDGSSVCGRDCAADNQYGTADGFCPFGWTCTELPELGEGVKQCLPTTGSCSCLLAEEAGTTRSCLAAAEGGACPGVQTCDPATGWSDCSASPPRAEECNGLDDDCDGRVDEDLTPPLEECFKETPEVGRCDGTWRCGGEPGWLCGARAPTAEACNYADDDCDDLVDEDFRDGTGAYVLPTDCGQCGLDCTGSIPFAVSLGCQADGAGGAYCVATECEEGYFIPVDSNRICLPTGGSSDCSPCLDDLHCAGIPEGRCDPFPDGKFCTRACVLGTDCQDGYDCIAGRCQPLTGSCSCQALQAGKERPCRIVNEHGSCLGVEVCEPELGWTGCTASVPVAERCNGEDDNCNLQIDEGVVPPDGPDCSLDNEWGTCRGSQVCLGAEGWRCNVFPPAAEICDYQDNDCDGTVDEGFVNALSGQYDSVASCGMCGYSCAGRIPFADEVRCNVAGALPVCEVVTCEAGYYRASETVCAAVTSNICAPCLTDRNCPVRGDRCLALDTGLVCGQDCAADNLHGTAAGVCPNGFVCEDFPELGEGVRQCVPQSGSCSCLAEHADNTRFCSQTNEFGTCTGFESCDPLSGWEGCSATAPAPELCDRRDNDCDGTVDEGFPDLNTPCTVGTGACFRAGVVRCADEGGGTVCGAAPGDPAAEVCNYQDDDCDGQTDQTFRDEATGLYVNFDHCGSCNISCEGAILFATQTACQIQGASAVCIALECQGDYLLAENRRACLPRSGAYDCSRCLDDTQCESLAGGRCEQFADGRFCTRACAVEADCQDGFDCVNGRCLPVSLSCQCLSVHAGDVRVCFDSNEAGTCVGTQTCDPLKTPGWSDCSASEPAPEECDGVDNDCNGVTDEAVQPPDGSFACQQQNELGTCLGIQVCEGLGGWRCTARVPAAESCNGIDDDCDGLVDEDFPELLAPCFDGVGGCRATGVVRCLADGSGTECLAQATAPQDERCNGIDDDCDGGVDEDFPALLAPCFDGVGACRAAGVARCLADGSGTECLAQAGQPAAQELCNGLDDDCDGVPDEVEFPGLGKPCTVGTGICRRVGVLECTDDELTTRCSADVGEKLDEECNGLDDDCDGETDETFRIDGKIATLEHCGACGRTCVGAIPNATAVCDPTPAEPRCVVASCNEGYVQAGPTQCLPVSLGICEPCLAAGDCLFPGAECADLVDGTFCVNPCQGPSDCPTGYSCVDQGEGATFCVPVTSACLCDGSDLTLSRGCQVDYDPEVGSGYSCFGVASCTAAGWSACDLPLETCNKFDDDCDGETDEGFYDAEGRLTDDENCGECGNDCTLLVYPGGAGACNTLANPPRCSVSCSGNCFDVNVNPSAGCECCNPVPTDRPDPLGIDANCDGMDGERDNGMFVAKNGDDANDGTIYRPKLTINAAILAAAAATPPKRDVYVATGVYSEAILLQAGVSVYGGYSSDYRVRNPVLYEVAILAVAPQAGRPGAVNAIGIGGGEPGATTFDGFSVFGYHSRAPGGTSYGIYVRDCDATLTLSGNGVHAGSGGDGGRGDDGLDGDDGASGNPGRAALDLRYTYGVDQHNCDNALHRQAGGPGGVGVCLGVTVSGGDGGERTCPAYDAAGKKTVAPVPTEAGGVGAPGGAAGGEAGWDVYHQSYQCEGYTSYGVVEGRDGADGPEGQNGEAGGRCGDAVGFVNAGLWVPLPASDGTNGLYGSGGGGGGSGAGSWSETSCNSKGYFSDNLGGTGGGGGAGACGGTAGTAGTGGGGAFGIFLVFTAVPETLPTVLDNTLYGGYGGDGGAGGNGGVGGAGGVGALGGVGGGPAHPNPLPNLDPPIPSYDADFNPMYPAFKGGKGGNGGNGGDGGGGGGGCGGPAIDLFVWPPAAGQAVWKTDNSWGGGGDGGAPGLGGFSLGNPGQPGVPGDVAEANF